MWAQQSSLIYARDETGELACAVIRGNLNFCNFNFELHACRVHFADKLRLERKRINMWAFIVMDPLAEDNSVAIDARFKFKYMDGVVTRIIKYFE